MTELLQHYVAEQAEQRGAAVAVVSGAKTLTYTELESASNRLAHLLVGAGCRHGDRVCLFATRSTAAIVGVLATLKAGCAYVPIDIASPAARLARIVRSAEPAAVLLTGAAALVDELLRAGALPPGVTIVALDAETSEGLEHPGALGPKDAAAHSDDALSTTGEPGDAAHILFTSGSTGEPKGVVITHANVRAFVEWAVPHFEIRPGERISGHPPLHFDLSTFDIYGTFRAGAELHLVPPDILLPQGLAEFISAGELTQWFSVPSVMTYMSQFGALPDEGFPSLERVIWCGEVLPPPVLAQWMERVPQAQFTNLYGPTETTVASSYYTVPEIPDADSDPVPIGGPCGGEEIFIADEHGQPVTDGETGELHIGGAGVARGYWRDEAATSRAFLADPRPGHEGERVYRTGDLARVGADGLLYFLGRSDSQIKSRGYRIELGEIEAAVNGLAEVAECAVVSIESKGFDGTAICCAFAPSTGADVTPAALRTALSSRLPGYMLPSRWKPMDTLPKNVNGKIDRPHLRELFRAAADAVPET